MLASYNSESQLHQMHTNCEHIKRLLLARLDTPLDGSMNVSPDVTTKYGL
jgi:hypothetical protein